MQLTGPQRRTLQFYLQHENKLPTWAWFFRRFSRTLVLWTTVGAIGSTVCVQVGVAFLALFLVGMLVGAALREIRQFHFGRQCWPVVAAIVNWERAQKLEAGQ